ncbi:hypothetical protein EVAR_3342_1 [Eumeta japonica]|uniref:Uncharacterized protein n=1 Tax=Eumeta variegata TaxID=151549 RepID=A0A4C1SUG1_EUMVA|nr:hypothetical protein EVAR_3342_1 [Eumeta japonica]
MSVRGEKGAIETLAQDHATAEAVTSHAPRRDGGPGLIRVCGSLYRELAGKRGLFICGYTSRKKYTRRTKLTYKIATRDIKIGMRIERFSNGAVKAQARWRLEAKRLPRHRATTDDCCLILAVVGQQVGRHSQSFKKMWSEKN